MHPTGQVSGQHRSSSDSNVQLTANLGGPVLASDCTHRSNEPQEPARVCILKNTKEESGIGIFVTLLCSGWS